MLLFTSGATRTMDFLSWGLSTCHTIEGGTGRKNPDHKDMKSGWLIQQLFECLQCDRHPVGGSQWPCPHGASVQIILWITNSSYDSYKTMREKQRECQEPTTRAAAGLGGWTGFPDWRSVSWPLPPHPPPRGHYTETLRLEGAGWMLTKARMGGQKDEAGQ